MGARGSAVGSAAASRQHLARKPTPISRLPLVRPQPKPKIPTVPKGLGVEGKAVWTNTWQSIPSLRVDQDRQIVTELCRLADQMALYRAALNKFGSLIEEVVVSTRGEVVGTRQVPNPASVQLKNALAASMAIYAALGLSPQSRSRLPNTY
jgi:P27 family predicted phage terminase small subunit